MSDTPCQICKSPQPHPHDDAACAGCGCEWADYGKLYRCAACSARLCARCHGDQDLVEDRHRAETRAELHEQINAAGQFVRDTFDKVSERAGGFGICDPGPFQQALSKTIGEMHAVVFDFLGGPKR